MCGRIYGYQHNAGSWDDISCDNQAPFICETMRSKSPSDIIIYNIKYGDGMTKSTKLHFCCTHFAS